MCCIQNQLKDGSVIQLYHKPTMQFVCLVEGGKVMPSKEDNFGSESLLTYTLLRYCYTACIVIYYIAVSGIYILQAQA